MAGDSDDMKCQGVKLVCSVPCMIAALPEEKDWPVGTELARLKRQALPIDDGTNTSLIFGMTSYNSIESKVSLSVKPLVSAAQHWT